jgi:pilus assembly protein Flp/PilA
MKAILSRFAKDKSGATAIEYGLIAALISLMVIAGATLAGPRIDATFKSIARGLGATVPAE